MIGSATHDLQYWVALTRVPRLGAARFHRLEEHFDGDMKNAWLASSRELRAAGVGTEVAQNIVSARETIEPERELEKLELAGVGAITWHHEEYPARLRETFDAPAVLYVRGTLHPGDEYAVAVVGTRRPTDYGLRVTSELCSALAAAGVTVVSGLAFGVDFRAHQATVDAGGRTIAVMGNGLDTVYPRENRGLAERIVAEGGALVSEFGLGVRPEASNFPRRNRIISGMTLGTLVTEASNTSGTRWTVYHALEQNREIFCVPGSIYSENSKLTNRLIREGAKLVTEVSDILVEIGVSAVTQQMALDLSESAEPAQSDAALSHEGRGKRQFTSHSNVVESRKSLPADPEESILLEHITDEPTHIDDLVRLCNRPVAEVSSLLAMLELKGLVQSVSGMHYKLLI